MALGIESRALSANVNIRNVPVRAPLPSGASDSESAQKAAQSFVNNLPADIRERVTQARARQDQQNLARGAEQHNTKETDRTVKQGQSAQTQDAFAGSVRPNRLFSQPTYVANLSLLQAQFSAYAQSGPKSTQQGFEASHQAYLNAGAQPGGEENIRKASLRKAEQAEEISFVSPFISAVNFIA